MENSELLASQCLHQTLTEFYDQDQLKEVWKKIQYDSKIYRAFLKAMHKFRYDDINSYMDSLSKIDLDIKQEKFITQYRLQLYNFFIKNKNVRPNYFKKFSDKQKILKRASMFNVKKLVAKEMIS